MHILALLILVFLCLLIALSYFKNRRYKNTVRQCAYGNVDVYHLLLNATDFTGLKAMMSKTDSFADRYSKSVSISRLFPVDYLEKWVSLEPKSPDALLCYGARLVQLSWDARGYGLGSQVSNEKWGNFFECLLEARSVLEQCAAEAPEDPTPWAYLIMISTWSNDSMDARQAYFEQAIKRDKYNWAAHMHNVIALSEKWGGDNQEMIKFAETVADEAELGTDLPIILIKAYMEHWKYLDIFEHQPEEAKKFIHSDEIKNRALLAYKKSLGSPHHVATSTSIFARYNASSWFWVVRNRGILKKELDELDNKIEDIHWRWAGTEGQLHKARQFVG